jgi:hypothetical protein
MTPADGERGRSLGTAEAPVWILLPPHPLRGPGPGANDLDNAVSRIGAARGARG